MYIIANYLKFFFLRKKYFFYIISYTNNKNYNKYNHPLFLSHIKLSSFILFYSIC